ncbi:MAG: glycine zipper domain-containing protein, partial [Hyphomicrobiaceae bacterium]
MRAVAISAALVAPLVLAGCGPGGMTQSEAGLAVGAVTGGIIGSQVGKGRGRGAATVVGAIVGGIVGSQIGRALDQQDRILAQQAELAALERGRSGEATPWRNPDNGRYGEVVPGASYRRGGQDCRDYTHTVY